MIIIIIKPTVSNAPNKTPIYYKGAGGGAV